MDEHGAAETRIRESLEALGFAPQQILDRVVSKQLSRMQQILAGIARALLKGPPNGPLNGPEVLLLDRLFEEFPVPELLFPLAMLRRVAKQRQLVVIVATHRPEVVALLGPKVAVLAHGSLQAFGPRAVLAEQPQSLEILRAVSPAGLTEIPGTVVRVVGGAPSANHSYRFEGPFGLKIPLESDDCPSPLRFSGNVAEAVLCVSPHDLLDADVTRSDPRIIRIDPATVEVMGDVTTGRWSVVPHDLSLPFLRIGREACDSRMAGCLSHPREIRLRIRRLRVFLP